MPDKVKRGLGLLVIALAAWLIGIVLVQIPADDGLAAVLLVIPLLVVGVAAIGGLIGGLALIAWGLLID